MAVVQSTLQKPRPKDHVSAIIIILLLIHPIYIYS